MAAVKYASQGTYGMQLRAHIKQALQAYMDDKALTARELGTQLGIANSTVSRWLSVKGPSAIRPAHWAKLRPLLAPHPAPARFA